jgi:hypothetical protein
VTVTGSHLLGATAVRFGGVPVLSYTLIDDSHLAAVSPTHAAGVVDVTIVTDGGSSATSSADSYTYVAAPVVTGVSPKSGPTAGGASFTVLGSGFRPGAAVKVGSVSATAVRIVSATKLTARTPAHVAGGADVTVTTPGGTSRKVTADRYTYLKRPTVTAVSPRSGSRIGGTKVTITGSSFVAGATVTFGGVAGRSVTVLSATKLTVRTRKHAKGVVAVVVRTPGGVSATSRSSRYTYV